MLFALALLLSGSPPESAPIPRPPLWSAPAGCPSEADVEALLAEERATRPNAATDTISTTAVATLNPSGTWTVSIVVRTASADVRRALELDSCEAAAEAVALVYGLALSDALAASPPAPQPPLPPPDPDPDPPPPSPTDADADVPSSSTASRLEAPEPPPAPPPAEPTPRARPLAGALFLGVGADIGTLRRVTAHFVGGAELVWPRLHLGLRIDHALVRRFRVVDDTGGNLSTLGAGPYLSVPLELGPVLLLPSAGLRAGVVRARGVGGSRQQTRWVPWILASAGLSLRWPVSSRWALRGAAELEVPLVRHTFTFDTLIVSSTRGIGGVFWIGPELRLGR